MTGAAAQMALHGMEPPDPVAVARAEADRLHAAWLKVCHIADSPERTRLQLAWEKAYKRWDALDSGPKWWH